MPFKKGQSGNPGGRPKEIAALVELARSMMPAAMEQMLKIICDDSEKGLVRTKAFELLSKSAGMANFVENEARSGFAIEGTAVRIDGETPPSGRLPLEEFLRRKFSENSGGEK